MRAAENLGLFNPLLTRVRLTTRQRLTNTRKEPP